MEDQKNHKQIENNISQSRNLSEAKTPRVVKQIMTYLKKGRFTEAANMFIIGQSQGVFSGDHTLTRKLTKTVGKNATSRLITAFAHYPCLFCKKGRAKCESCDGRGYKDHDKICELCLGLGVMRCDFCDGSGWMAMEDIPEGLRVTVMIKRAQTALARMKLILRKPVPKPLPSKPSVSLKSCVQLWVNLDRYMGVLENTVVASKELTVSELRFKNQINKINQSCVEIAIKSKRYMREIIKGMEKSARLESGIASEDSTVRRLAKKRADFYKNLLNQADDFLTLGEEHPFLEKAIKKCISKKPHK